MSEGKRSEGGGSRKNILCRTIGEKEDIGKSNCLTKMGGGCYQIHLLGQMGSIRRVVS